MKYNSEKAFPFLISTLFLFPLFKESILTILVSLLTLNTIIYSVQKKNYQLPKKEILILTLPFWITLIVSLFYFDGLKSLMPINNSLLFLILPLTFNYIPKENFTTDKINKYFIVLKNVCLLIVICYVVLFFYKYTIYDFFIVPNQVSKFRNFIYNEISFFKIHPAYFTTILIFITAFSLKKITKTKKWYELIYIIAFLLITFLLITKINVIFITLLFFVFVFFQIKRYYLQKIILLFFMIGMISFLFKKTPGLNERFYEFSESLNKSPIKKSYNSTNIRVAIYKCDINLIKENFWLGVGFKNIKNEIESCLNSNYNSSFNLKHQYLSHNYYFYILISGGIFSLIFFLYYLFTVYKIVLKSNLFVFYTFFINILLMCMIEDFFYRVYGLFFFNLIVLTYYKNNLFLINKNHK